MPLDYYLFIDGIPGDATARGFEGQIVVTRWGWSEGFDPTVAPPDGTTFPLRASNVEIAKSFDRATPKLMLACASRQLLPQAVLSCVEAGRSQSTVLRMTLSNPYIATYHAHGTSEPETRSVLEEFGMAFDAIELEFTELRPDGMAAGVIRGGWNLRLDQPC
jgi:type VI secretion system secreted protein Hcp